MTHGPAYTMNSPFQRRAILFAVPGTTCPEASTTFAEIDGAARQRFPDAERHWTYTSAPIRRKLAAQGCPVPAPADALAALAQDGMERVAVVSLHMTDGMEFGELAEVVEQFRHTGAMRVSMGRALMSGERDWERAVRAVLGELPGSPDAGDRIVLVAHGSREPRAVRTLQAAAAVCARIDPRLMLGMMLGAPGLDDTVRTCQTAGARRVWLVPCLVAAGYSVRDEIAGTGERSWRSAFERVGIACTAVTRGLGEYPGIVEIWVEEAATLLNGPDAG